MSACSFAVPSFLPPTPGLSLPSFKLPEAPGGNINLGFSLKLKPFSFSPPIPGLSLPGFAALQISFGAIDLGISLKVPSFTFSPPTPGLSLPSFALPTFTAPPCPLD